MRRRIARMVILASVLSGTRAFADDDFHLRFSPSLGAGILYPRPPPDLSSASSVAFMLDLTVEAGPLFFGAIALVSPASAFDGFEHGFFGAKVGYTLGASIASAYASAAAGYLLQDAFLPIDEGTLFRASGLGFELEAGAILFRRPGLGRVWIFGFALLPTFDIVLNRSIPSFGWGVRLAL
ncbi:MAG: hypothetical protein ACJ79M_23245 [Myxococcales bacterium]